jgi:uncharacterized protein YneF (UPF0154 family)
MRYIILGIVSWFVLSLVVGVFIGGLLKRNSDRYDVVREEEE